MNHTAQTAGVPDTLLRRVLVTIPNLLSFARLGLGLWFPWAPVSSRVVIVIAGGLTDLLDGTLSRLLRATTVTGRIIDPIADKLFVGSVLLTLLLQDAINAWQAGLVAFRDIAVVVGVLGVMIRGGPGTIREMPPRLLGKCATVAQFAFFLAVLWFERVPIVALLPTAGLSILAGADYLRQYLKSAGSTAIPLLLAAISAGSLGFASTRASVATSYHAIQKSTGTPEQAAIAFLEHEVPAWSVENRCFSCHNNGDGARALYTAAKMQQVVAPDAIAATTRWLLKPAAWDDAAGDAEFKDKRLARIQFAAALVAAMRADQVQDGKALREAAALVASDQEPDGAWHVLPAGTLGSPVTYGRPLATAMALATLRTADPVHYAKAIARGDAWLHSLQRTNTLELAATLIGLDWADERNRALPLDSQLARLISLQTDDGAWGPFPMSPPEVFDTAAALVAIAPFSMRPPVRSSIERGRHYLVNAQLDDGSWPETTRPPGGSSYAQRLSTTAWATLALLQTHSSKKSQN